LEQVLPSVLGETTRINGTRLANRSANDILMTLNPASQNRLDALLSPKRNRILVAEDDPISSRILQTVLEKCGYETVIARNGSEAWDQFDKEPMRLIVSDWMMPGMDGVTLCEKVRARAQTPYTYFILLTANHPSPENCALATAAGVDDFLTKPLNHQTIQMRLTVAERILKHTTEIRQLRELIPICIYCRKVRDEHDYWERVESYIQKETGSRFSHGACPQCYQKEVEHLLATAGTAGGQPGPSEFNGPVKPLRRRVTL
jgi:sigma-B regulation protein RsbU (phosphoserine phosphatase)